MSAHAHAAAGHTAPSLLETVADHESALMKEQAAAEAEAQRAIDAAHAAATAAVLDAQARLDAEIGERRRAAAAERDAVRGGIERDAADKVSAMRTAAGPKLGAVRDAIVRSLLPGA